VQQFYSLKHVTSRVKGNVQVQVVKPKSDVFSRIDLTETMDLVICFGSVICIAFGNNK